MAYDSDLAQVTEVVAETLAGIEGIIHDDPAPAVYFQTFGDSAINLSIYFWCETTVTSPLVAKDRTLKALKVAFERANIEIPFPVQKVLLEKTTP